MSDYAPKTEMVKTRYAIGHGGLSDDEEDVRAEAFDRWLAERDRQVAERAWDEGHRHCFHVEDPNNPIKGNPYRKGASDE